MIEAAQNWIDEQLSQQRELLLVIDRLAEPDPIRELFSANLMQDYVNLYQDTEFADLADVGPWLVRLNNPNAALVYSLLDTPQRDWGWLASAQHIDLASLTQHWHARLAIDEGEQRSVFRFQDNRVMARSLAHMEEHQLPQLLGPLNSVLCWGGEAWHSHENPQPGPASYSQPAPWLYPEPGVIRQETRLANLEQWLWENQPEATSVLARHCNVRSWLAESLALANEWGWLVPEQVAFLLSARRGPLLSNPGWQPLPKERCDSHFTRCRLFFSQPSHIEQSV